MTNEKNAEKLDKRMNEKLLRTKNRAQQLEAKMLDLSKELKIEIPPKSK